MQHSELHTLRAQYSRGATPRRPLLRALLRGAVPKRLVIALPGLLLAVLCVASGARAEAEAGRVLRDYLQARMQGDLQAAEALWDPRALRLASAMGIRFTDVEAAYDDYWMLSASARQARAAQVRAVVRDSVVEGDWVSYTVVLEPREEAAADTLSYLVKNSGGSWHVSLPLQELTANWTRREGRFLRVRTKRIVDFSQHALTAVENEIARLFEEIGAPQSAKLRLERLKLDYFLCENADDLRQLVGSEAHEGYLPAAGRIVSRSFVDLRDVVPLLVQLTLRNLPLHNEPIFEEGLPLALGGTAAASAGVVLQRARNANLDGRRLRLAFEPGTSREEALPLEALWNRLLLNELGPEAFLELVRNAGEKRPATGAGDNRRVLTAIEQKLGKKGDALWRWGATHVTDIERTLNPGCESWPADVNGLEAFLRWRDKDEAWSLLGYVIEDRYVFTVGPYVPGPPKWVRERVDSLAMEFAGEKPEWEEEPAVERPSGDPPPIFFLVRAKLEEDLEPYESAVFRQQFLSRNYRNDLWGFFVTPDEVKLYGYTQNKILAEYVVADSPAPSHPFYMKEPGRICFSVPTSYFPRPLTAYYVFLGIYTGE